jgi:hypothetical protein
MTRYKVAHADTIPLIRLWGAAALRMSLLQLKIFATTAAAAAAPAGGLLVTTHYCCMLGSDRKKEKQSSFKQPTGSIVPTTACLPTAMATGVLPRTEQRCSSTAAAELPQHSHQQSAADDCI